MRRKFGGRRKVELSEDKVASPLAPRLACALLFTFWFGLAACGDGGSSPGAAVSLRPDPAPLSTPVSAPAPVPTGTRPSDGPVWIEGVEAQLSEPVGFAMMGPWWVDPDSLAMLKTFRLQLDEVENPELDWSGQITPDGRHFVLFRDGRIERYRIDASSFEGSVDV